MTLEQRRVLLKRVLMEVEAVTEDVQATATSLLVVGAGNPAGSPTERATLTLLWDEQRRQQLELLRLYGEYDSLAFRRRAATRRSEQIPAAA